MYFLEDAREVYSHLQDDISRRIFITRLNYSATFDMDYILKMPAEDRNLSADVEQFCKCLRRDNGNRKVLFGAGTNGQILAQSFRLNFFAFIDNFRSDKIDAVTGLPIYALNEYLKEFGLHGTEFIITVNKQSSAEAIKCQLLDEGINENDILMSVHDWRNNASQYFDLFIPHEHEAFVDCGCYDGSTAFRFAGWCGNMEYDKIWSFEPDAKSYERCKKILAPLGKCEVFPYGISNCAGIVNFATNGNEDARIVKEVTKSNNQNIQTIQTVALDEFLKGERITFIKMDIEGAEYDALLGGATIIREQKPKLAISVYHDAYHFVTIPKLLLKLRPDYKLWMRHYSLLPNETVLYAE